MVIGRVVRSVLATADAVDSEGRARDDAPPACSERLAMMTSISIREMVMSLSRILPVVVFVCTAICSGRFDLASI